MPAEIPSLEIGGMTLQGTTETPTAPPTGGGDFPTITIPGKSSDTPQPPAPAPDPKGKDTPKPAEVPEPSDDIMSEFENRKAGIIEKPKAKPAPEPPAKPADPVKGKDPAPTPQPPAAPQQPSTRDYTGFSDAETNVLKRMSNEAFAYVAPILKEHKTLKTDLENSRKSYAELEKNSALNQYYDETGYVKTPEFQAAIQTQEQANWELQYWQKELVKVEAGEQWNDLQVNAQGQLIQVPRAGDVTSKAELISRITRANAIAHQSETKAQSLRDTWEAKAKEFQGFWAAEADRHFPELKDQDDKNEYIKAMASALSERGQANNPLAKLTTRLYATTIGLRNRLIATLQELQKLQTPAAPAPAPTTAIADGASGLTPDPKANPKDWASDDEFDKRKQGAL